jgi:hypothetical protein
MDNRAKALDCVSDLQHTAIEKEHESSDISSIGPSNDFLHVILQLRRHMRVGHDTSSTIASNRCFSLFDGICILDIHYISLFKCFVEAIDVR